MNRLIRWFKRASLTGIEGVYDQRLRFEIISVNQLCLISIALSFIGTIIYAVVDPSGNFKYILFLFALLFLLSFYLNKKKQYFWAKFLPILNVQWFYFIIGIDFGLDAQAQSVFLLGVAYVILFFTRQKPGVKALLIVPSILLPATLFYIDFQGLHLHMFILIEQPIYLGIVTYMITLIAALALSLIIVGNINVLEYRLNRARIELMNANAHLRTEASEVSEKAREAAHDLRSPVASAVSLAEIMEIEEDPEDRKKMEEHLHRSLKKLKSLVDEILATKGAGQELLELNDLDIKEELGEVLSLMKHYPGFSDIAIYSDIEKTAPLISDKKYLNVLLSNLISNAIKYSDKNKPNSFIKIDGAINELTVNLEIKDNGIGISEEKLPYVFKKNVRATEVSEGTGLGLALVKRTVQILDGDVEIQSIKGEGTTVYLTFINFYSNMNKGKVDY